MKHFDLYKDIMDTLCLPDKRSSYFPRMVVVSRSMPALLENASNLWVQQNIGVGKEEQDVPTPSKKKKVREGAGPGRGCKLTKAPVNMEAKRPA